MKSYSKFYKIITINCKKNHNLLLIYSLIFILKKFSDCNLLLLLTDKLKRKFLNNVCGGRDIIRHVIILFICKYKQVKINLVSINFHPVYQVFNCRLNSTFQLIADVLFLFLVNVTPKSKIEKD